MPQPTDCYCNVTPHGCLNCIRRESQEENRELSQNLAPHHVRPQFVKSIFTPDDFAFLRSEVVRVSRNPHWSEPRPKPRTRTYGQYVLRLRASLIEPEPYRIGFTAYWARLENPEHFEEFCPMFKENGQFGYEWL